jgi:LPS-assembly lipoprotein
MRRLLITFLATAALSACGFHPRAKLDLPNSLGPVAVVTADSYSPLGLELASSLSRAGASAAVEGQPSATLKITGEQWQTAPLSVDQFAQVREYVTRYKVTFALQSADGKPLIEPQDIELSREYTYDQNASAGSPAEQELIQKELRRDMEAAILRRLDVALRHQP